MVTEYNFKRGKKLATYDKNQLRLSHFESTTGEPTPAPIGFDSAAGLFPGTDKWEMLGNDNYGDCVWAGGDHEEEVLLHLGVPTDTTAEFSQETALADYASCTGFNPDDPNSDQGTDMGVAMKYRRHTGLLDINGSRHKIGAYLALEPGNFNELLRAMHAFAVVGIGIEFPDYAMDQFNANKAWTYVKGQPAPTEGHYIPGVGRPLSEAIYIITWARKMQMSMGFYQHYNDESYVYVTQEDLVNGVSPAGYDFSELNAIISSMN